MTDLLTPPSTTAPVDLLSGDFGLAVPDSVRAAAKKVVDRGAARLQQASDAYQAAALQQADLQIGEPTLAGGYKYWDCVLAGPYQFFGDPPYRPANIIAAGELGLMVAYVWINPLNSPGGGLPGTIVLGARSYNAAFETINLSDVKDGPDFVVSGVLASPAPVVTAIPWFFVPGAPSAPGMKMFETNFAIDVSVFGQLFAAFSTEHWDPDDDPGFIFAPPSPPHYDHGIGARWLAYVD